MNAKVRNAYKPLRAVGVDEPIFRLPPYRVDRLLLAAAETVDWGLTMLNVPSLWRLTEGAGIKVAVLDTGVDFTHPDLHDAIAAHRDFTGSAAGSADLQGHGTHVAGIIAARKDGGGVVGVAPAARLLVGKVLGDNGAGSSSTVQNGIRWAMTQGADVISMSLGSGFPDEGIHQAIREAEAQGIFVICAAGNDGAGGVNFPGAYPECVAVGAIDRRRAIAAYSSLGPEVDVVAPGDQILSTYPTKSYATLSGTSMATPFVAGVAALILAKHREQGGETPVTSQQELLDHLSRTAIDLGPNGFDNAYGFGLVNPADLLESAAVTASVRSLVRERPGRLSASPRIRISARRERPAVPVGG